MNKEDPRMKKIRLRSGGELRGLLEGCDNPFRLLWYKVYSFEATR